MNNFYLFTLGLAAIMLSGCGGNSAPAPVESKKIAKDIFTVPNDSSVTVTTATASIEPSVTQTKVSGIVDFDPDHVTRVYSLVNGAIELIDVHIGDQVHKGQVLAAIRSSDLAQSISDFQKASAQWKLTQKALAREQALAEAKIASQKDVLQAESDEAQAKSEYNRALNALQVLGGNETTASSTYMLRAPIDGVVVESNAQPGAQVKNDGSQNIFTVGNTANLLATFDIYPNQLGSVALGDDVAITATVLDGTPIMSPIKYVSSVVDPASLTTKVRCPLVNTNKKLEPQMFLSGVVYHHVGKALYVPSDAVFFDSDAKTYVFVKLSPREYQKREVTIGQSDSTRTEILQGVNEGDLVAANQAIFLNDEMLAAQPGK